MTVLTLSHSQSNQEFTLAPIDTLLTFVFTCRVQSSNAEDNYLVFIQSNA
jgi:hypothetical protein